MFYEPEKRYVQALIMLDLFASVHVRHFDITKTTLEGEKSAFFGKAPLKELRLRIPATLDLADKEQNNIIIRPCASPKSPSLVQLDDLDSAKLSKVEAMSFMTIETSPGNHQAWIAIAPNDQDRKEIASRLRRGTGADIQASGATRIAGSLNFKPHYAPDFPLVAVTHQSPAHIVTLDQLQALHLLSAPESWVNKTAPSILPPTPSFPSGSLRKYPDYARCLAGAPLVNDGSRADTSKADFTWCLIAASWGFHPEQIAAQLLREREINHNASRNKMGYALATANKAAAEAEKNRARRR